MTQYVINIGALPNDGTGDPLRTAFNETNLNFDQVFAAGPVLSNVRIANNTILTTNTNGNLILAPNGIGRIQANATVVPSVANVRNLGSTDRRWSTVYTQYIDISGGLTTNDLIVNGNLTVQGNIIQIGNLVTDAKTIQLSNTATTANAANGSGITVGANDNIATILYSSATNTWNTNIGISAVGNITANYLFGNGSQLTGIASSYGNANVATFLANFGSNVISTTGNISGSYILGNGSQLTGLPATYNNANVVSLLANFGSNVISTTGNISGNYFIGNGSQLTNIIATTISNTAPALGNGAIWWNTVDGRAYVKYNNQFIDLSPSLVPDPTTYVGNVVFDNLTIENVGNILPATSNVYSLGSAGFQWKDLWISNNTIYINSVPVALGAGNVLTVNGEALLSNDSNTSIATTGNISAANLAVTGGSLSWPNASIVQTSAENFSITGDGQVTVRSLDGTYQWTFGDNGTMSFPTGGLISNYPGSTGVNNDSWLVTPGNGSGGVSSQDGQQYIQINNNSFVEIGTSYGTANASAWTFGQDGDLGAPGNISTNGNITAGNILVVRSIRASATASPAPSLSGFSSVSAVSLTATGNISATGNVSGNYILGNGAFLTGVASSYGNADVANFLGNYGSNTIVTTGNITGGNLIATANVLANGYARLTGSFDESQASTAGLYLGYAGGTPRMMFGTGNTNQTLEIDNDGGTFRFYKPGTTLASLTNTGNFSVTGNITAGNIIAPASTANTQILFNNAGVVGGSAAFTFDTNGNTLNLANSSSTLKVADIQTPTAGVSLRLIPASGITYSYGNFLPLFANTYDLGGSGSRWNNMWANVANVVTLNTTGNVNGSGATFSGNVTAANFSGNISITGNVTGTSPNVTLVAGSYSYVFDNTGALTLPAGSGTGGGDEGGEIAFTQAANSTLAGNTVVIDNYVDRFRFFESGGNARGAYIDLSIAADGVGTLLNNRASGIVNAGVDVTLGNLRARIPTSGNRSLQVSTVSGTYSVYGSSTYNAGGTVGGTNIVSGFAVSVTTTPAYLNAGNNFATAGDSGSWIIMDTSAGLAWRISFIIGASFNNNMISIERLV